MNLLYFRGARYICTEMAIDKVWHFGAEMGKGWTMGVKAIFTKGGWWGVPP